MDFKIFSNTLPQCCPIEPMVDASGRVEQQLVQVTRENIFPQIARTLRTGDSLDIIVVGNCMAPLLCDSERVSVRKQTSYYPGDILVFADANGRLLIHRLLGWVPGRGELRLMTRPDAAPFIDVLVPASHVLGLAVNGESGPLKAGLFVRGRASWYYFVQVARLIGVRLGVKIR